MNWKLLKQKQKNKNKNTGNSNDDQIHSSMTSLSQIDGSVTVKLIKEGNLHVIKRERKKKRKNERKRESKKRKERK